MSLFFICKFVANAILMAPSLATLRLSAKKLLIQNEDNLRFSFTHFSLRLDVVIVYTFSHQTHASLGQSQLSIFIALTNNFSASSGVIFIFFKSVLKTTSPVSKTSFG